MPTDRRPDSEPDSGTESEPGTESTRNWYWERHHPHPGVPIMVGAAGLVVLTAVQLIPVRHRLEDSLTIRSRQALDAASLPGVSVTFTGQDAALTAGSEAQASVAAAVVASVDGVRAVNIRVLVPTHRPQTPPAPTGAVPTSAPTGAVPTSAPTGAVPTSAPTSAVPTSAPADTTPPLLPPAPTVPATG